MLFPARSLTDPATLTSYSVPVASISANHRVTEFDSSSYSRALTVTPSMKIESSEVSSIASEKTIRTGLFGLTSMAPAQGRELSTTGGSLSSGLDLAEGSSVAGSMWGVDFAGAEFFDLALPWLFYLPESGAVELDADIAAEYGVTITTEVEGDMTYVEVVG